MIQLVNLRASRSNGAPTDVFEDYFPPRVYGTDCRRAVLNSTRHTPRDVLRVMRGIQDVARGQGRLSVEEVKDGLRRYSVEYFLDEIEDELSASLDREAIKTGVSLLTALNGPAFTRGDLAGLAVRLGHDGYDVDRFISALFESGAIGIRAESRGDRPGYTYRYRYRNRRTHAPTMESTCWLHPGLWKAIDLEIGPGGDPDRD